MQKFYATYAEVLAYGDHYEVATFNSEQERDDWLNYKDTLSLTAKTTAENCVFKRLALEDSVAKELITQDVIYIHDNIIQNIVWIRC